MDTKRETSYNAIVKNANEHIQECRTDYTTYVTNIHKIVEFIKDIAPSFQSWGTITIITPSIDKGKVDSGYVNILIPFTNGRFRIHPTKKADEVSLDMPISYDELFKYFLKVEQRYLIEQHSIKQRTILLADY